MNQFWNTEDPFESKIKKTSNDRDCWIWQGSTNKDGYGQYKGMGAHRMAWMRFNKEIIPIDHEIHHTCKNPSCCNPGHLVCMSEEEHHRLHGKERTKKYKEYRKDGYVITAMSDKQVWWLIKNNEWFNGEIGITENVWSDDHRRWVYANRKGRKRNRATGVSDIKTGRESVAELKMNIK